MLVQDGCCESVILQGTERKKDFHEVRSPFLQPQAISQ